MSTVEQPIMNTIECPQNLRFDGYPDQRLHIPNISYLESNITLKDGSWETGNVSDIPGEVQLPTDEEIQQFTKLGLEIDDLGRPLHPNLKEMIGDMTIGVVTGRGFFRKWGPNYTADPIIVTKEKRPRLMLIERGDGGGLAFSGGFVDAGETPVQTAVRETGEEAGKKLERTVRRHMKKTLWNLYRGEEPVVIFEGPVPGEYRRTTAHAWTHTTGVLFRTPRATKIKAGDDAIGGDYYYLDEQLPDGVHPGHRRIINEYLIPFLNRK